MAAEPMEMRLLQLTSGQDGDSTAPLGSQASRQEVYHTTNEVAVQTDYPVWIESLRYCHTSDVLIQCFKKLIYST